MFGLESAVGTVTLSGEHQAFRWVRGEEMLVALPFETQREGLRRVLGALNK